ncbi:hypothetical protein CMK12_12395, partial [Candidatus Poribacteria bacterium]|nr:hypothetical protein [Candidatus Poribacteria bacterium]
QPNLLVDGCGVPLSLVVSGANRHDVTQLEIVWDEIVIERPDDIEPQRYADKGYNCGLCCLLSSGQRDNPSSGLLLFDPKQ